MSKEHETLLAILTEPKRIRNYVERLQGLSFNDSQALARHIKAYVMQAFDALPAEGQPVTRLQRAMRRLSNGEEVEVILMKSKFTFKQSIDSGYKLWMNHLENPVSYRQIDIPFHFIKDFLQEYEAWITN